MKRFKLLITLVEPHLTPTVRNAALQLVSLIVLHEVQLLQVT